MKHYPFFVKILVLSTLIAGCVQATPMAVPPSALPGILDAPTASGLTPASLDPIIGKSEPVMKSRGDWLSYSDDQLGIAVSYPSVWEAIPLQAGSGVGLYPPGSDPNVPTPMIRIEWLNVPYSDQPIVDSGNAAETIEVSGVRGRQYQDSQFAIPTQSHYIELPYHDGVLFFITTEGPAVDLTPQLWEILKTLTFLDVPAATEAPVSAAGSNVLEVTISAAQGWQDTSIRIEPGMTVTFEVIAGQWTHWQGTAPYNTGDGDLSNICADRMAASQCVEPLPDFPQGGLIGMIDGVVFGIGSLGEASLPEGGNLYLRINDGDVGLFDNDGELTVRIILSN